MTTARGLTVNQSPGGKKKSVVYSLFCIFIIIISVSVSIYFVALLNCLNLNPRVSPFVHFSSPPCWGKGRGEREAVWC